MSLEYLIEENDVRILVAEPDRALFKDIEARLSAANHSYKCEQAPDFTSVQAKSALYWDAVLMDVRIPHNGIANPGNCRNALYHMRQYSSGVPVILLHRPEEKSDAKTLMPLAREMLETEDIPDLLVKKVDNAVEYRHLSTDPVTGLMSQKIFHRIAQAQYKRVTKGLENKQSLYQSIVFMDLNGFKKYNDVYGHNAGNDALRTVGELLCTPVFYEHASEIIRPLDFACRLGGDEFLLTLEVPMEQAAKIAARIEDAVQKKFATTQGHTLLSLAAGIAQHPYASSYKTLLENADKAMYVAKGMMHQGATQAVCGYTDREIKDFSFDAV